MHNHENSCEEKEKDSQKKKLWLNNFVLKIAAFVKNGRSYFKKDFLKY